MINFTTSLTDAHRKHENDAGCTFFVIPTLLSLWGCVPEFSKKCVDMSNSSSAYLGIIIGAIIGGVVSWWVYNRQKKTSDSQDWILAIIKDLEESHDAMLKKLADFDDKHESSLNAIADLNRKVDAFLNLDEKS